MSLSIRYRLSGFAVAALLALNLNPAFAQEDAPAAAGQEAPAAAATDQPLERSDDADVSPRTDGSRGRPPHSRHGGNEVVSFAHDAFLPRDESATSVVAILGSATSEGVVSEAVVSIIGDTRVTGPVGEAAVAVLGDTYVNSSIGGDVVAVLGDVELGPEAAIGGEVVAVGGTVRRDEAALVHGKVEQVAPFLKSFSADWLKPWFTHCLRYARLLALEPGLGWAWGLALAFLALYVAVALLFRQPVEKCVKTFEEHPGHSVVTALAAILLTPILMTLLVVTVVGIAIVPFVMIALFCASIFGKAVMLAWLGRRVTAPFGEGPFSHVAVAVLVGGLITLALYMVPVLSLILFKVLGWLGMGVVVYTLLLTSKRPNPPAAAATAQATVVPPASAEPVGPAPSAESLQAARVAEASLPRAGFWIRMGALLIDVMLVGIVLALLDSADGALLIVLAAYGALMWKFRGTTVGGVVCNLKVVRPDARPIDWSTAVVRALGCLLSLVFAGLGFLWIAIDRDSQAWHDKIAGTVVVRVPKGVSLV